MAFAIRHSAIHFAKTAGKIAAVSEDADHGGKIKIDELKENVPKTLKHLGLWEESRAPPGRDQGKKEITFDPSYSQLI